MEPLIKLGLLLIISSLLIYCAAKVTVDINPGCPEDTVDCNRPWAIVVYNSEQDNETEYYHVWSGTDIPSIVTMQVAPGAQLSIDWAALVKFEHEAITTTPEPLNVFSMAITEMILFNDAHDTGSVKDATELVSLDTADFVWLHRVDSRTNDKTANVTLFAESYKGDQLHIKSEIALQLANTDDASRNVFRPSLQSMASSTAAALILDNILKKPENVSSWLPVYAHPRWATRMVFVSSEERGGEVVHASDRSLNDEFAPGVFKLDEITTPRSRAASEPEGGYLQWRPVCYLSPQRDINKATLPGLSTANSSSEFSVVETLSDSLKRSLVYVFLGDDITTDLLAVQTNVSFGEAEDGYYEAYSYTVWTWTIGSGQPPTESLSTSVLVVIICGLGLPVLVMILAGIGLGVWRVKNRNNDQQEQSLLNEEPT